MRNFLNYKIKKIYIFDFDEYKKIKDNLYTKTNNPGLIEIDINNVTSTRELFSVFIEKMKFPNYFGFNWDAFDECIRDLSWLEFKCKYLVIQNSMNYFINDKLEMEIFIQILLFRIYISIEQKKKIRVIFVDKKENLLKLEEFIRNIKDY
ncbi:MAG: barstar family protein [bacterium]